MDFTILYTLMIMAITMTIFQSLKKGFFKYENDSEIIKQSKRCFVDDFSKSSQIGEPSYPTTKGCKVTRTSKGLKFTSQSRLCNSSIL